MQVLDDKSFFCTRECYDIRAKQPVSVTLRRSHWRCVEEWARETNTTLEEALADLQSDIVAAWAGIERRSLSLELRLLAVLLFATSCTTARSYGAGNDNALYGASLFDWIEDFNPRVPPFSICLPSIVSSTHRMPKRGAFVTPRAD